MLCYPLPFVCLMTSLSDVFPFHVSFYFRFCKHEIVQLFSSKSLYSLFLGIYPLFPTFVILPPLCLYNHILPSIFLNLIYPCYCTLIDHPTPPPTLFHRPPSSSHSLFSFSLLCCSSFPFSLLCRSSFPFSLL